MGIICLLSTDIIVGFLILRIFIHLLRLRILITLPMLLNISILSRLHHASQQLDAFARLVTVILHLALLRLQMNPPAHSHLATAVATRAATTSTLTALHDLAFWKIRLRNLSLTVNKNTYSTDAHRFEIVLVVLCTLQTTQLFVSLLRGINNHDTHLLPHGDQILVGQFVPNTVVIHLAVDHPSFVGFPNVTSVCDTEKKAIRSLVMNLKNGPNRLLFPLSIMRSTLG